LVGNFEKKRKISLEDQALFGYDFFGGSGTFWVGFLLFFYVFGKNFSGGPNTFWIGFL
jgi:hypothetical protein